MLYLCPHCGHDLPVKIRDGFSVCANCSLSFDTSPRNLMMCAGWMCIRQSPESIDRIADAVGLTECQSILVETFILFHSYSMEDFRAAMSEISSL